MKVMLESKQTPEAWWIVAVPHIRILRRFVVVTPFGLERGRFWRRASAEAFVRQCHAAGESRARPMGHRTPRPGSPRRIRPLGRWMVGVETWSSGGSNYVVASPNGLFMEDFAFLQDAEACAKAGSRAYRARRIQKVKAWLRGRPM